jgi:hypothetical protein
VSEESEAYFNNVPMFPFGRAILLMSMRTGNMMCNPHVSKKRTKGLILSPPIGLHGPYFSIKLAFNKSLEITKTSKDIRLLSQQIDPRKFAIIIYETHVILISID